MMLMIADNFTQYVLKTMADNLDKVIQIFSYDGHTSRPPLNMVTVLSSNITMQLTLPMPGTEAFENDVLQNIL